MANNTSWQVKAKYNNKVYKRVVADLPKQLVADWEEKLKQDGVSKAGFIKAAIEEYLK